MQAEWLKSVDVSVADHPDDAPPFLALKPMLEDKEIFREIPNLLLLHEVPAFLDDRGQVFNILMDDVKDKLKRFSRDAPLARREVLTVRDLEYLLQVN